MHQRQAEPRGELKVLRSTSGHDIAEPHWRQNSGQILVEYLLLLVVVVATVTVLTQRLVGRGDTPGIVTGKWIQWTQMVANDPSD